MTVDRNVPTSATPGPVAGADYMDKVAEEIAALWDVAAVALTNVAGTANAITADCFPALAGNAKAGMIFTLTAVATNSGAVTLAVAPTIARPLNTDSGAALAPGQIVAGRQYLIVAGAAEYRVIGSSNIQKVTVYQEFAATGTWNKPAGTPDHALVEIEGWGAGGGGGANGTQGAGGGGGSYGRLIIAAGYLPASVAVTIGTSAIGSPGGSTSFGAYLVIPGGGPGAGSGSSNTNNGGGGGGSLGGAGTGGTTGAGGAAGYADATGGAYDTPPASGGSPVGGADAGNATTGGGGGGGGDGATYSNRVRGGNGGRSLWGGGGGAGRHKTGGSGTGGSSVFGGAGGNAGASGAIPGGGGGANAPGGRGELRIRVIG